MAGSDRDAFHVKNRTDVLRMRAVHHEREDGGLVRRGTDDAQTRYFRQTPRAVFEQRVFMCGGGGDADRIEPVDRRGATDRTGHRSEETTSKLQSLMRHSYAVFDMTKK